MTKFKKTILIVIALVILLLSSYMAIAAPHRGFFFGIGGKIGTSVPSSGYGAEVYATGTYG